MSDADQEASSWQLYIQDMIEFSNKVLSYTDRLNQGAFITKTLVYDATLRNLELIFEAATHIPSEVREVHPEIQCRRIIARRNRLAHGYLGKDDDVIWNIIQNGRSELATGTTTAS